MKKILLSVALICAAMMSAHAEVVQRDTVAYTGNYRLEKVEKENDYGEVNVRYVCFLLDVVNKKGEPRKVTTDKATYTSGKVTHIVYNTSDSGSRKIAKAINKNVSTSKKK